MWAAAAGISGRGSSVTLFGNAVDLSQANGAGVLFTGSTGDIVYNNAFYGPTNTNAVISQASTSTGALVKNNIFYTGAYAGVDASSETGTAYDYNIYFSASGTPFNWGGTAYTFSELAGEQFAGRAFAQLESLSRERSVHFARRELFAAGDFAGDQCGSESRVHVSDGAIARVHMARWRLAAQPKCGGQRVGNWRVCVSSRTGRLECCSAAAIRV